ncbi:MAG: hypothetical protein M3O61_10065, partial [Gemmatimonadota bacterium]|nr:hypothetical protein [Gemmatimonadota bacterium]
MRIFLFDLDDTIYDRTPHRFAVALERVGSHPIIDQFAPERLRANVESIRALGPMFEAFDYPSTQDRTDPRLFLAGMLLLFGSISNVSRRWQIPSSYIQRGRRFVKRIQNILSAQPPNSWERFLSDQLLFRQAIVGSGSSEAKRIIEQLVNDGHVAELASQVADTAPWTSRDGFRTLWSDLTADGVTCYIASEGEEALQREKLASLDLGDEFLKALLTSQRASSPLDAVDLVRVSNTAFAEAAEVLGKNRPALQPPHTPSYVPERSVVRDLGTDIE